jgi:hypothetical protein
MQHTYHLIGELLTGFAIAVMLTLLILQVTAFHRHRHKSFLLLCISSLLGITSASLGIANYLSPPNLATIVPWLEVRSIFYVASAMFGIWGTISLFNSYRTLSVQALTKPPGNA